MDRVDACLESMVKNLGGLVRGASLSVAGAESAAASKDAASSQGVITPPARGCTDDHLLEVVASQLVHDTQELFSVVTELQKGLEVGSDVAKAHASTVQRRRELALAAASAGDETARMREDLTALLRQLEDAL